jgi:hypothetical protein
MLSVHAVNVIPVEDAMQASKNFLTERVGATRANQLNLVLAETEYSVDGTPVTYRFNVGEKGYIIVSATDLANPVLAFSLESNYKKGIGADLFMERYAQEMAYLMNNPSAALPVRNSWNHYLAADFAPYSRAKGTPCVEPLITTKWDQGLYYNTMCPTNPGVGYNMDGRSYVGCVALTMANILYYYRYPDHGYGSVYYIPREYDDDGNLIYTYPAQYVNYGTSTYDYDDIANSLEKYDGELAKLLYHCGVSVRMSYGSDGSGSQSEYAMEALQDRYFYNKDAQFKALEDVTGGTDSMMYLWENLAKEELNQYRPLFFSGQSQTAGGHAWIVDGYITINNATYFHVNWGWAGSGNGYFLINNQVSQSFGNFNYNNANNLMTKLMPDSAEIAKPAESFKRVTATFGTISDGAGNMKYAQNSNRRWVLACPNATAYKLQFSKLKVKSGDKVIVYNGGTEASGVKKEYSGSYLMAACSDYSSLGDAIHADYEGEPLPASITVNADSVLIVFTSTANSATDYGFVLDYEVTQLNANACTNKTYTDQTAVITDKPNNAISDEEYRASAVCEHTLNLQYSDKLVCAFQKFDLGQGDFVDIYTQSGVNSSTRSLVAHFDNSNPASVGEVYNFSTNLYNIAGNPTGKYIIRFAADNNNQGSGFEFTYFGIQTGLNNLENVNINLYPNPVSSVMNIQVTADDAQQFSAKVVDMMGKTVYVDQFDHIGGTSLYQISVNNLAKGVYFLHLNSSNGSNGSNVQKFIVE